MRVSPPAYQVGVTPVKILDNNPNRLGFTIINLGAGYVMLAPDIEVSATRGIYLASGGGGVNFKWDEEFELVGWEHWAMAQNANTPVFVLEIVALGESFPD